VNDVDMAIGHGVERPWVNGDFFHGSHS
jgi:hypothetical protein